MPKNALYYGDNLSVLPKHVKDETVDLVYLDPPFKSDSDYNILFQSDDLQPDEAQWTAFKDTWLWDHAAEEALAAIQDLKNVQLVNLINALHGALGTSPMMAFRSVDFPQPLGPRRQRNSPFFTSSDTRSTASSTLDPAAKATETFSIESMFSDGPARRSAFCTMMH